jgi:fibronectin-binding autotransporter adhesin
VKTTSIVPVFCGAVVCASALADVWDNSAGTSQWSSATNWADNTEPTINDFVTFPNTIPLGLSTITLSSGEFAQSLTFLNNYTLSGGNIQLGNGMITAGGWTSSINSVLAGSGPLTFGSSGTITLGASSNSYTGGTNINGTGMTLVIRSNTHLGFNTAPVNLNGGRLRLDGSVNPTFIMLRPITPGSTGGTIDLINNAFLDLNAALGANANSLTFTGATGIAELNTTTARTGATIVNGPVLRLNNANAAGTGQVTLQGGGVLELANNITFNAPVLMNNGTTLRAGAGTSTFNGTCNIPSATAVVALSSGPLTSDLLTLGTNGASVWNGSGTTHVTSGIVRLNSMNDYAGNWLIEGMLQVDHTNGLGTGTTPIDVSGMGRLRWNAPLLARDITLNNPGGGLELLQDATVVGHITTPGSAAFVPFIGPNHELTLAFANSSFDYAGTAYFGGVIGIGSFRVSAGADVTGTGTRIYGNPGSPGSVTVSGAGSTWLNSAETWVGNLGPGTLLVEAGGTFSCPRIYVGQGEDGTATVTGDGSLVTSGELLVVGFGSAVGTLSVLDGADVASVDTRVGELTGASGAVTVSGSGSLWTNQGGIEVGKIGAGALDISSGGGVSCLGLFLGSGAASTGSCTITGGVSTLDVGSVGILMSQSGASSTLDLSGGLVHVDGNITDMGSGVSTLIMDGATLDMMGHTIGGAAGLIDNLTFRSGTLKNVAEINDGAGLTKTGPGTLYLNTPNSYGGTTLVSEGTLFVVNSFGSATGTGPVLVPPDAALAGPGQIAGPLNSNGHVAPEGFAGNPFGTLTVENNYNQSLGGTLHIDVGGPTQFDRLVLTNGAATLEGTLNVNLMNGFVPAAGDTFEILSAVSVSGTFASVNLPSLPNPLQWQIEYGPTDVRLNVISSEVPGDVDGDGHVSLNDLTLMLSSFGLCVGDAGFSESADFNGDGCIDLTDLTTLLAHFGL